MKNKQHMAGSVACLLFAITWMDARETVRTACFKDKAAYPHKACSL